MEMCLVKVELRSSTAIVGVLCVTMNGHLRRLWWSAGNWATPLHCIITRKWNQLRTILFQDPLTVILVGRSHHEQLTMTALVNKELCILKGALLSWAHVKVSMRVHWCDKVLLHGFWFVNHNLHSNTYEYTLVVWIHIVNFHSPFPV